jgi:zinc finger protein
MSTIQKQQCPFCRQNALTLIEEQKEIPYFGKVYLFSMNCTNCKFNKADVEAEEQKEPSKTTFTIEKEADMKVRVVKSANATVKIPQMRMNVTPGPASIGYISNIEGLLNKFVSILEHQKEDADEDTERKHAKNLLKKMRKVKLGDQPLKIIIEDPSGNSAIISEKAIVEKLKIKVT